MFFNTWAGLGRALVSGVLTYVALIFLVRLSGKRTLSKMNAFDLVVTIALGSVFATIILLKDRCSARGRNLCAVPAGFAPVHGGLAVNARSVHQIAGQGRAEPAVSPRRNASECAAASARYAR